MKVNPGQRTDSLEERSHALFEDSVERLDGRTRSRLTQARHAALDELKRSRSARRVRLWLPAGGLLAVAAVAVLFGSMPGNDLGPAGASQLEDFDIVADSANLDLLQDVEFYAWLAEQALRPAGQGSG